MDDRSNTRRLKQLIVVMVSAAATITNSYAASIIADGSAAKNQQPIITETASGIPQVNIQTPNSHSVSRNRYKQFDVEGLGAILNNSAKHVQTQLGGWVQGNSLLAGGTARIILNEVRSQNPSLLHGPVEVAGDRAQVVIANPAGISCDGCGFINAHRSTLTTGNAQFSNGMLNGFRVDQGHISISGQGMDDRETAYSDIIARTVSVNADIWANDLNISTGLNQVNRTNQIEAIEGSVTDKPALSIDVAELGGMYAQTIRLIGSEHGVGVRHAGHMKADKLILAADGKLTFEKQSVTEAEQVEADVTDIINETGSEITATSMRLNSNSSVINRGVLDGQQLRIEASNIENYGTGKIYADDLILEADAVSNQFELLPKVDIAEPVIAARQTLKVGADSLYNSEGAVIYSDGDATFGGYLDNNQTAQGSLTQLINQGGLIEAEGNLALSVLDLQNLNAELITEWQTDSVERIREVQPEGWSRKYDVSRFPKIHNHYVEKQPFVNEDGQVIRYFEDYTYYDYYATTESTHLISSRPAKLIAGGDLTFAGNVLNKDSHILAGGSLSITGGSLANLTTAGEHLVTYQGRRQFRDWEGNDEELDFYAWTAYSPAPKRTEFNLATTQVASQLDNAGEQSLYSTENIPTISGNWFQQTANTSENFFIETDPRFVDYQDWLSSDYMFEQMALDPSMTMKRLGDGFIEQRLVREQVAQLTGQRFLSGFSTDEAQFMALMEAGVSFAEAYQLTPGVALSAEQVAMLTSDIVWLEQQEVALANGETVKALVPKVYVKAKPEDFIPGTGLLAGNKVDIQVENGLVNTGTVAGRDLVNLDSDYLQQTGGRIQGEQVQVKASNISIEGGTIQAEESLTLIAQQNINISSATSDTSSREAKSRFSRTNIKRVAGLYVTGNNGQLNVEAGRNMVLSAANIQQSGEAGEVRLSTGNDLILDTVRTAETNNSIHNAKDFNKHSEHRGIGTRISAQGDISLDATNHAELSGANINSQQGKIAIRAGKVDIKNATASYSSDIASHTERDGTFSSKAKDQRDHFHEATAVASVLSGKENSIESESDINITGSHLVADEDLKLQASGNIGVQSAEQNFVEEHYVNEEESGVFSNGGIGFTVGSQELDITDASKQTRHLSSEVGSLEGNVSVTSGQEYNQQGSNVMALQGDVDITAAKVDIESAMEVYTRKQTTEFSQSGLSISITNPVISAMQTADQMSDAAEHASDPRMKALAAAATALDAKSAYDSVMVGQGSTIGGEPNQIPSTDADGNPTSRNSNAADKVGGINLSISFGSSESRSHRNEIIKKVRSSKVVAGGDINISAVGAGQSSDLTVAGSKVQAGGNVRFQADDQLNLEAAKNSRILKSKNHSSSGSVGASIGTDGLLFTAGMAKGKGKENGQDTNWTETTVKAGEMVKLQSAGNTQIKGAIVSGNQVAATVGNNLNIQSLQDSSSYDAEQKNIGGSISVGYGKVGGSINLSASDIESDYVSVIEQSGIQAGDNGFQIKVEGNTNLDGAVIASTLEALDKQRNSSKTDTLTWSDIKNQAEYEADAGAVSLAMGTQAGEPQLTGSGIGSDNGSVDSVSVSAVSDGELQITDDAAQKARTEDDASTTIDKINRGVYVDAHGNIVTSLGNETANAIRPIFDEEKVANEINAQVEITQTSGQQAYKAVNDYVQHQRGDLQDTFENAETESEKMEVKKQLDDLLFQERVMNVLIGAVSGMGKSAVTKESLSIAAAEMREIMVEDSMQFAGVTDGKTTLSNQSGESVGVRDDGFKLGGTRIDLDKLCGPNNKRCETKNDGTLFRNAKNQIIFKEDLSEFLITNEGKKLVGLTGGIQGRAGKLFGISYESGSWQDRLVEAFSGTHDMIGGQLSGLYDEEGNATRNRNEREKIVQEVWSGIAIAPSAPFAMAEALPSEVWHGISVLLRSAQ